MDLLHYINNRLNELRTILIKIEPREEDGRITINPNIESIKANTKARIEELETIKDKLNLN